MQIQKRDTQKIKTNPKYKCVDEGSEGEDPIDLHGTKVLDDPQALSSKELDFRETILKHESKGFYVTCDIIRAKKEKGEKAEGA